MKTRLAILALVALIFATPVLALLWMTAVPGRSHEGPLPALTPAQVQLSTRLRTHVEAIAREPHNLGHPEALERAATYLEATLAGMGYAVIRQPFDGGRARNLEVVIDPADPKAPTLVVGAHYDSAFTAPGANDNATGTAAVLELARTLADLRGKAAVRIRLVLFVNEEPPFFQTDRMGSLVHANRLKASGERVDGMFSLETLGYYSDRPGSQRYPFPLSLLYPDTGNFVAFVGTTGSRNLVRRTVGAFRAVAPFPSVGGTAPAFVQGIDWSDHWAFEQNGIPALMITDTAPFRYPHYHRRTDTPDKIDYDRLARVVTGLEQVIRRWRAAD
ncbi:M20/M25/M40 family metallo-hydrolase [Sphingomonas sp. AOB5]|uniref:M28 family peptidase n=1 Tax=Sphingomonas sp. AOB5 TaxID=3034017 RepID=UPI0023F8B533|nr:M28 family peptidase [Sphingomonas sp. AOB5]MDF7774485.1 M20/M25/M40 family metallo-hydrolase [Sphingomonas sp. AOB5]